MQAPAKSTHRRSLKVPARLPERMPASVLGLELAAGHSAPDPYPGRAVGARPRPPAAPAPRPAAPAPRPAAPAPRPAPPASRPAAPVPPPATGRGRRGLMLAACCMSLFMVGLDNTIV